MNVYVDHYGHEREGHLIRKFLTLLMCRGQEWTFEANAVCQRGPILKWGGKKKKNRRNERGFSACGNAKGNRDFCFNLLNIFFFR